MKRFRLATTLGLGIVIGVLIAAANAAGHQGTPPRPNGHNIRWDLVQLVIPPGAAIPGGIDVGRDAATHDTVDLTGSGDAEAHGHHGDATGGGTFVHRHENGTEVAHGIWVVTGFQSWHQARGTFPLPIDGVGHAEDASAGVLTLDVRLYPAGGAPVDGVLGVNCHFPDTPDEIEEGITLDVATFHFTQHGGATVFHVTH